jgi:uncharacterized protein YhhL (DUF1145 family)
VRETLNRAIRRLNVLEYVILLVVAILSLAGGALIALLAGSLTGVPFRITWAVASILIFAIPAIIVWGREHRVRPGPPANDKDEHPASEANG